MDIDWQLRESLDKVLLEKLSNELNIPDVIAKLLLQRNINNPDTAVQFFQPEFKYFKDPYLIKNMDNAIALSETITEKSIKIIFSKKQFNHFLAAFLLFKGLSQLSSLIELELLEDLAKSDKSTRKVYNTARDELVFIFCSEKTSTEEVLQISSNSQGNSILFSNEKNITDRKGLVLLEANENLYQAYAVFQYLRALFKSLKMDTNELFNNLILVALEAIYLEIPIVPEYRFSIKQSLEVLNQRFLNDFSRVLHKKGNNDVLEDLSELSGILYSRCDFDKLKTLYHDIIDSSNISNKNVLTKITKDHNVYIEKAYKEVVKKSYEESLFLITEFESISLLSMEKIVERISKKHLKVIVLVSKNSKTIYVSSENVVEIDITKLVNQIKDRAEEVLKRSKHRFIFKVSEDKTKSFIYELEQRIKEQKVNKKLRKIVKIDSLLNFNDLNPRFIRLIKLFSPYSKGNPEPIFMSENLKIVQDVKVVKNKHLVFDVNQNGIEFSAIGYHMADRLETLYKKKENLSLIYFVYERIWNGLKKIELRVIGIK